MLHFNKQFTDQKVQDAGLRGNGLDPIELFTIAGLDEVLGFIQNHRVQSLFAVLCSLS